jgi:hypothetical protein
MFAGRRQVEPDGLIRRLPGAVMHPSSFMLSAVYVVANGGLGRVCGKSAKATAGPLAQDGYVGGGGFATRQIEMTSAVREDIDDAECNDVSGIDTVAESQRGVI